MCPNYEKFCYENFENGRKDQNGRRQTTFGLENEEKFNKHIETETSYSHELVTFLNYYMPLINTLENKKIDLTNKVRQILKKHCKVELFTSIRYTNFFM